MSSKIFSIILPTHNRAHRIEQSIRSILDQTYANWELLILDDASTDGTEKLILPFLTDSRIRYFKNETNQERCNSRNRGIREAKGEYICFLDSDDYHLPFHLETLYQTIKDHTYPKAFFFTNAWNESEIAEPRAESREPRVEHEREHEKERESKVISAGLRTERVCPDYETVDPHTYFLRYTVNPQRWCVHREVMLEHLFDPEVVICEDMDTSLRMVAAGVPVCQIKERTTVYVAASDSFTHGDPKKWEKELFYLKRIFAKPILKKHLPGKEKRRLLSMCYFHLGQQAFLQSNRKQTWNYLLRSFLFFPKGYNGQTNKIMFVNLLYSVPLIGKSIKHIKHGF